MIRRPFFRLMVLIAMAGSTGPGAHAAAGRDAGDLVLSDNGATDYVIVKPEGATPVDEYAASILAESLKQATKATFPVLAPSEARGGKRIFVGLCAPAKKAFLKDPAEGLEELEFVVRSAGDDIFLFGKGLHGNLYAVVDFLDNTLGRRWFVDYEKPAFTRVESLVLKPFERRKRPSFLYRMLGFPSDFYYQNGYNLCLPEQARKDWGLAGNVLPAFDNPIWVHTSFLYIPTDPGRGFDWLKDKGYFATNPEFYSQTSSGHRSPDQLCYGGRGLRDELTKNILAHLALIRKGKTDQTPILIALDQEDAASGKFCYCPACIELEARYRSPAGAFYDYLLELGPRLKKEQPDVLLKIIAYRRSQTEKPPVLPKGQVFPDNIVVVFCSVEDVINKTWKDPENRETYENLLAWRRLTPRVWGWNYFLYHAGLLMPFSHMDKMALEMRMMKDAGVEGASLELYPEGGLTDVLPYLFLKLAQDVNADVRALLAAFCENQYGPAARLARTYIEEVEAASKTGKAAMNIIHANVDFDGPFSYLTDARLRRWQGLFDDMDRLAGDDERFKKNVNRLRKSLDLATLAKWSSLAKADPAYFKDYTQVRTRIGMVNLLRAGLVDDWMLKIQAGDVHQPLPPLFKGIPPEAVHEFVPLNNAGKYKVKNVLDPEAAFGYATIISDPDMPFHAGFHQKDAQKGTSTELERKDIAPNAWKVYPLGEIRLTPNCMIWFSNKSWMTNLELGGVFKPDADNLFDAYVSLKFEGPTYGGTGEDRVLCDRIILVNKGVKK